MSTTNICTGITYDSDYDILQHDYDYNLFYDYRNGPYCMIIYNILALLVVFYLVYLSVCIFVFPCYTLCTVCDHDLLAAKHSVITNTMFKTTKCMPMLQH